MISSSRTLSSFNHVLRSEIAAQLVAAPDFGPSSDRLGLTSLAWAEAGELETLDGEMIEGWVQDRHFIVFTDEEAASATTRYDLPKSLLGFTIVGLLGWDDFIVRNSSGDLFTVPTVPAVRKYLAPFQGELPHQLEGDHRAGKIKWYVNPVVFGGNPESNENMIWVSHHEHAELVRWWNTQYQTITRLQETSRA